MTNNAAQAIPSDLEFWRLRKVIEKCGISKSEVYRRMKDSDPALNPFPPSRPYRSNKPAGVFWRSDEVSAWQIRELIG